MSKRLRLRDQGGVELRDWTVRPDILEAAQAAGLDLPTHTGALQRRTRKLTSGLGAVVARSRLKQGLGPPKLVPTDAVRAELAKAENSEID